MHPDTFDVRRQAKLLNNDRFAIAIRNFLAEDIISHVEDVDETPINDEIRTGLFGDDYADHVTDELNDQIGEATRPSGPVYQSLDDDGYEHLSLCTARVRRKIKTETGGSVVVSKMSRFLSDDADVIAMFRLRPQTDRLERTIERVSALIAQDVDKVPALAGHVPGMIAGVHRVMNAALPAGPSPSSNANGGGGDDE